MINMKGKERIIKIDYVQPEEEVWIRRPCSKD
jgi:hypothetical protein